MYVYILYYVCIFRQYALRRIRDSFKGGKSLADSTKIMEAVRKAEENLEIIKRQVRYKSIL
jgi:hypothetical protein